jgi:hypothetical protein
MTAGRSVLLVVVWAWVAIPFLYGVWSLLQNVGAPVLRLILQSDVGVIDAPRWLAG